MYNIPNDALALATITTIPQKVNFDDNGRLESVRLTSSSRRALLAQDEKDAAPIATRRLDFDSCSDCEEAYDAACEGALSVCDLEDFGYPLSAEAAASVDIVCGNFGSACSRFQASVACLGQCTPEGVCRSTNNCWLPRDEVCMIFNCFVPASDGFFCTRLLHITDISERYNWCSARTEYGTVPMFYVYRYVCAKLFKKCRLRYCICFSYCLPIMVCDQFTPSLRSAPKWQLNVFQAN